MRAEDHEDVVASASDSSTPSTSHIVRHELFDVDAARDLSSRLFYAEKIQPLTRDPFRCELAQGTLGPLTVGHVSYGAPVTLHFADRQDSYGVAVPLSGHFQTGREGREFVANPRRAAVVGPTGETTATGWRDGNEVVLRFKFERAALERELSQHLGREITGEIDFGPQLDLSSTRGAQWARLARFTHEAFTDSGSLVAHRLMSPILVSSLMSGLLLATDHRYRGALDTEGRRPVPALIRRAADYMDTHAHEPITSTEVATYVGASPRTLQRGFLEHLDTTPHRYLARVRMARAHEELLAGNPDTTSVSDIATRWGFFHHGRFAARYRAEYGVQPSVVLRGG